MTNLDLDDADDPRIRLVRTTSTRATSRPRRRRICRDERIVVAGAERGTISSSLIFVGDGDRARPHPGRPPRPRYHEFRSTDCDPIDGDRLVKTKSEIVKDWLPRYTGRPLDEFGKYILLSNFLNYVDLFAERFGVEVMGRSHPMQSATAEDLTILNFGMGSAMAATVMDLLAAIEPKAVLFLGKCGGLEEDQGRRLHPADRRHPRRGDQQRLHAAGDPRPAVVPPPEGASRP